MPARNAASHIREAIASVLAQGLDVDALIVVDDGSSDATAAIVRTFGDSRIRLVANDGSGVSAARNAGARAATGEWLMFLDADDRLRPGAIAALLQGRDVGAAGRRRLWRLRPHRRRMAVRSAGAACCAAVPSRPARCWRGWPPETSSSMAAS